MERSIWSDGYSNQSRIDSAGNDGTNERAKGPLGGGGGRGIASEQYGRNVVTDAVIGCISSSTQFMGLCIESVSPSSVAWLSALW